MAASPAKPRPRATPTDDPTTRAGKLRKLESDKAMMTKRRNKAAKSPVKAMGTPRPPMKKMMGDAALASKKGVPPPQASRMQKVDGPTAKQKPVLAKSARKAKTRRKRNIGRS